MTAGGADTTIANGLDHLLPLDAWHDDWVERSGSEVHHATLVSIGGGMGSLALVDLLRLSGMTVDEIRIVTPLLHPHETYAHLARNSQIPDHERIRSDAGSEIDNVWGFPSYAFREAADAQNLRDRLRPLWTVLTEPILADYFTPRSGQVYRSVERECARIGWSDMVVPGQARAIRRRVDGGYFVVINPLGRTDARTPRQVIRCRHVHLSVGYPGLRFLPDLQRFKEEHNDPLRVVNAYENHDHIYDDLRRRAGMVVVRGSGIVASRVIQRLLDDNEREGASTTIVHLFRNYVDGPEGPVLSRRPGRDGFAYQAFNYPKAAWGGQLREQLLQRDPEGRRELLATTGGTNTAPRRSWRRQLERAAAADRYRQLTGTVAEVRPADGGLVLDVDLGADGHQTIGADYVIDATGLLADVRQSRILADVLDHCGASVSPLGRIDVSPSFEIRGTDSGHGRMFASGSITLGGPYAPVDSFLGLQYVAYAVADELAALGTVDRFGTRRSIRQWWRWVRGQAP